MSRHARSAPTFGSARLAPGHPEGSIPRRVLGRTLVVSLVVHAGGTAGLLVLALATLDPIAGPPIVVHFIATSPPPPRLAPRREPRDIPQSRPKPPPIRADRMEALLPPVRLAIPEPPRRRPDPPMPVEAALLPVRPPEADLLPAARHAAPPAPRAGGTRLATIGARPLLPSGSGEAPELEFLVPGRSRPRGAGGGLAGAGDGLPPIDHLAGTPSAGRRAAPDDGGPGLGAEESFGGTGLAATLGQRYGVSLVDASRLGQRSSDGARYTMLVPVLSEAFRAIQRRGAWRGPAGDPVESAQIDAEAIVIRYRDGTVHVIVPTGDGLVALYVSAARRGAGERSKVDEADRALGALRRLSARESQG